MNDPAALIQSVVTFFNGRGEIVLVGLFTVGFFLFSRHVLHREIVREKTMASIIVSAAFAVANMMLAPVAYFANDHIAAVYAKLGIPAISQSFWADWPWPVLALISLVLYDFIEYWNHRWLHTKYLWPIHAIHHSDPDVNGLTTYRVHFLQIIFNIASFTLFLSWLGMPKEVAGGTGLLITLFNAYVHLDVSWDNGPLRLVLASPKFHRWHHADTPEFYGKNIANMFPIWDILFGTYIMPGVCQEPMGARGVPENNFVKLMLYPFTEWGRMLRKAFGGKAPARKQTPVVPAE